MPYAILNSLIVPISEENTMPNLNSLLLFHIGVHDRGLLVLYARCVKELSSYLLANHHFHAPIHHHNLVQGSVRNIATNHFRIGIAEGLGNGFLA